MSAEHFIPLRRADLIDRIAKCLSQIEHRQQFKQLSRMLEARFHFDYHSHLETLKQHYAPFDPDADTLLGDSSDETAKDESGFFENVISLLDRANYRRLSQEALEDALNAASDWGVKIAVDFDAFERLEVYVRGDSQMTRTRRSWKTRFRNRSYVVPVYKRLVIAFRLKQSDGQAGDASRVYLKMFKDIPKVDVEMLLPATRVQMSLLDRGRIFLPTISGVVVTIYKVVKGAFALAFAGVYGILAFLGLVGGAIGYGVKSFMSYVRARDKYRLNLTTNLYYQNLDNNAGVLFRLIDEAEEQECREALLAYYLLWQFADEAGWTADKIDREAEFFLQEQTGLAIDFEVGDALAKLERLELVEKTPNETYRSVAIETALVRLDREWDNFFQYNGEPTVTPGFVSNVQQPSPDDREAA